MRNHLKRPAGLLALVVLFMGIEVVRAAILGVIDFESHPAGAVYGSPALPSGSLAFTESGVPFRLRTFTSTAGASSYNAARISSSAAGQSLELNNVMLAADFSAFNGEVNEVVIEYVDLGGQENLRVNGSSLQTGDLGAFVSAVSPGVELFVTRVAIAGGVRGKLLLRGRVDQLEIGGQEFFIDNIRWSACH